MDNTHDFSIKVQSGCFEFMRCSKCGVDKPGDYGNYGITVTLPSCADVLDSRRKKCDEIDLYIGGD